MTIPAIGAIDAFTTPVMPTMPTLSAPPSGVENTGFANALASSIESLQAAQGNADTLAIQAVTGDLDDIHDYTIASSEAKVQLELLATFRNKAVEAFTEIMRMQA